MTREQVIVRAQYAAFAALPLLTWDEAGVVARDVLDAVDELVEISVEDDR